VLLLRASVPTGRKVQTGRGDGVDGNNRALLVVANAQSTQRRLLVGARRYQHPTGRSGGGDGKVGKETEAGRLEASAAAEHDNPGTEDRGWSEAERDRLFPRARVCLVRGEVSSP
jgi:hypothetical protein